MSGRRKAPIRTCVSCRTSGEKKELIRIVRSADGEVRIDPTGKMPGRGAYLCGAKECSELAVKAKKLSKALRCEIPERLKAELESFVAKELAGNSEMTMGNRNMKAE